MENYYCNSCVDKKTSEGREGGGGKESAWKYHLTPNCTLKIPVVYRPSCLRSRIELVCFVGLKGGNLRLATLSTCKSSPTGYDAWIPDFICLQKNYVASSIKVIAGTG